MMRAPSPLDFLAAFGVEPAVALPKEGRWLYAFDGPTGTTIQFSFDQHERSVQARVLMGEESLAVVVRERATSIRIDKDVILVSFEDAGANLALRVFPTARLEFSDLDG